MLAQSRFVLVQWLGFELVLVLRSHVVLDLVEILDSGSSSCGTGDIAASVVCSDCQ